MSENINNISQIKKLLKKLKNYFSIHYVAYTVLFAVVTFSVIQVVQATTPNPGHPWIEIGDGAFQVTYNQTATRTYTFPDANATILTTNSAVTVPQGGTGLSTIADKSLIVTTASDTLGTLVIPAGQSIRRNAGDTAFEAFTPGTGIVNSISIASLNGFSGSSSGGVNPSITLNTTITGLLKGDGSAISQAIAGTDYLTPSGASSLYVPYTGATGNVNLGIYNLVTPTILGGSSTSSDLTFQTTSGVGATGADMHFLVGSNGGTEAMTILNNGNVGIGTIGPSKKLEISGGSEGTNQAIIGNVLIGDWHTAPGYENYAMFRHKDLSPSSYAFIQSSVGSTYFNSATGQSIYFAIGENGKMKLTGNIFSPADTSGDDVDLGSSTYKWKDLWLKGNAYIDGNIGIGTFSPSQKLQLNYGHLRFDAVPAPTAPTGVLAGLGAGNIPNGTYQYSVTYVTSTGESTNSPLSTGVVVSDNSTNGQISLTVPLGATSGVTYTARKIYRASVAGYWMYYIGTINDNTTTTYVDNVSAGTGVAIVPSAGIISDTTAGTVYKGTNRSLYVGIDTSLGEGALQNLNTNTYNNVAIGKSALNLMNSGRYVTAIGSGAMGYSLTSSDGSTAVGYNMLPSITGMRNTGIGMASGYLATTLANSIMIGYNTANTIQTGNFNLIIGNYAGTTSSGVQTNLSNNTIIGDYAGKAMASNATNNLFLGNSAGRYETASNKLFIDNLDRTTEALGRTNSLIYGISNTTAASQILSIGGGGNVGISTIAPTARLHLPAGSATANTSPLKFTSGTLLGTTEGGAIEYDGSHLYFTATDAGVRYQLDQQAGGSVSIGGSISGATEGSILFAGPSGILTQNNSMFNWNNTSYLLNVDGDVLIGAQKDLRLSDSDASNWVAFESPATVASNVTWTLPASDADGCFKSNGSGTMSISACGDTNIQTFSSNGTYTKPSNALLVIVEAIGAGGGGGGGGSTVSTTARTGGGAGGGGAYVTRTFASNDVGATVTVTRGTGGNGGNGGTNASGTSGSAGGNTTFGTLLTAFGGGGGRLGVNAATASGGGGGGGIGSAGATSTSATGGAGGGPGGSAAAANNSGVGGGGGGSGAATPTAGGTGNFGGGGGGGSSTGSTVGSNGGGSMFGAAGGGGGGSIAASGANVAGGIGGRTPANGGSAGGGGTGGTAGGGAGNPGTSVTTGIGGYGGGGGGSNATAGANGGAGGAGGSPGGGGGGGGSATYSATGTGGAGGAGGNGAVRVWTLRGAGADLAEIYGTFDSSLEAGDVVSLDKNMRAGVKKTDKSYDDNTIGVISTKPGLVIGNIEDDASAVTVALSGRVPVKVNLENGPIYKGDYLTSSSVPGVAMKAVKSGIVIGQAMTEYTDEDVPGYVVAFIKSGPSNGVKLTSILPGLTLETESNTEEQTILNNEDNPDNETLITPTETIQKMALKYFLANKSQLEEATDISEIYTDRLSAALEIITPTVITDTVETNSILVSTGDVITFGSPASFDVPPLFNKDTAGFAIIHQGGRQVDILYENPYLTTPVVNASLSFDIIDSITEAFMDDIFSKDIESVVINSSQNGFTILLNKEAPRDLRFSWNAFSVKDPNVFESVMNGLVIDPDDNQENDTEETVYTNDPIINDTSGDVGTVVDVITNPEAIENNADIEIINVDEVDDPPLDINSSDPVTEVSDIESNNDSI